MRTRSTQERVLNAAGCTASTRQQHGLLLTVQYSTQQHLIISYVNSVSRPISSPISAYIQILIGRKGAKRQNS